MALCDERRIRLHGLDLSTKHEVSDTREPEMKKATQMRSLYNESFIIRRHSIQQTTHGCQDFNGVLLDER